MKAIIAGGGIGGLTVALCLRHFGWNVCVLEQAEEIGEVGAGLQLSPNAMKVFQALNIENALKTAGFTPEAIELRLGASGLRLLRAPLGDTAETRWGAPYLHIHRADLVQVLCEALASRAPGVVKTGAQVTGYEQSGTDVCVHLSTGETVRGDILVGADGLHSTVRTQILGPDTPLYTGNLAWRAVIPINRLGAECPHPVAGAWMGRGRHAITYLLRGGELANFVGVVESDETQTESWTQQGARDAALADFKGWHPTITRLIKEADALFRWALYDREPFSRWSDGRTVLLGDAAHPMPPFMAQGAAMAIEDAWMLAALLAGIDEPAAALDAYFKARIERTSRIQAASRQNANTFHKRSFAGRLATYGPMWLAGRIAPGLGLQRQDQTYAYDVVKHAAQLRR